MFRVFIVEDNEPTSRRLASELKAEIPQAEVTTALTYEQAETEIEVRRGGVVFDAVILDSKIPKGGIPQIVTDLCPLLHRVMPGTFVVHMTAYSDDPSFQDHFRDFHVRSSGPRGLLLPKEGSWDKTLINALVREKIERQLDRLMDYRQSTFRVRTDNDGTFRTAVLAGDIERHWHRLPDGTKDRIHEHFDVDETNGSVTVSLGGAA